MIVLILIVVCFGSFFSGFLAGAYSDVTLTPHFKKQSRTEIAKLQQEFKNFLEYDGSEQK